MSAVQPALSPENQQTASHSIVTWRTVEDMEAGWPVIQQMYTHLTLEKYREILSQAVRMDYRQFAYLNEEGECLGVVGLWLIPRIWCELQVDIDNFAVDSAHQSKGIGKRLLNHCLAFAQEAGASIATLDTKIENTDSHRFYYREGFIIRGYHFVKPLQGQSLWSY